MKILFFEKTSRNICEITKVNVIAKYSWQKIYNIEFSIKDELIPRIFELFSSEVYIFWSIVLFRIKKNHYIAICICSKNLLFLCFASLQYLTYIFTSGQRYLIPLSFFTLSHFHVHGFCHFDSVKYPAFLPTRDPSVLNYLLVSQWTRNEKTFDGHRTIWKIRPLASNVFWMFSYFLIFWLFKWS